MLIQHPTPAHIDYEAALAELDPDKDADGQHPMNMGRLALGMPGPLPCTPAGIEALLAHYDIPVAGREVVILGRGFTLGRPLSMLLSLKRPTANAAVTVVHTRRARLAGLHPPGLDRGRRGRRAGDPATRAHPARARWSSAAASATKVGGCCPTSTSAARTSPAGSRLAIGGRRPDHHRHAVPQHRRGRRASRCSLSGSG